MGLSTTEFWALAALAGGRLHGYGIVKRVDALSEGAAKIRVPTLYATLERLESKGMVAHDGDEQTDGRLRRYFAITESGRSILQEEVQQMNRQANNVAALLSIARTAPVSGGMNVSSRG